MYINIKRYQVESHKDISDDEGGVSDFTCSLLVQVLWKTLCFRNANLAPTV